MTEESAQLIQQLVAHEFEFFPKVESPEQRKGILGIVNLFALASHVLTAMTGTLAIISVDKDGEQGVWDDAGLHDQVHRLVDLSVQTSASMARLIGMAMMRLQSELIISQSMRERESIRELMTAGYTYIESLNAVSLETTNMARWRGVWGRKGGRARCSQRLSQTIDPDLDKDTQSVRTLISQILELGLRAELYEGTWSMD